MIKKNRYSENKILTPNEQELLSQKRVAVIGCGGLGGYAAEELARLGIGELVLCDGDSFVNSNLNRQLMCTEDNIGCSKAVETAKRLFDVNSEVKTIVKKEYFDEDNAIDILKDCHLLGFAKAQTFPVEIGVQRVYDIGWQATVKKEPKNVVAVMSGSLKPYLYFVCRTSAATNGLEKSVKAFRIIGDGEYICQDFAFRAEDEAVVLVLGNVNTHTNHDDTSDMFI